MTDIIAIPANRVEETSRTSGTGALTLSGVATPGNRTFASAFSDGTVVSYSATAGLEFELGYGTYTAGVLTRDQVVVSSNSNALVAFTSARKVVFCDVLAADVVTRLGVQTLKNKHLDTADGNTFAGIPANAVVGVLMADGDLRAYGAPNGDPTHDTALVNTAIAAINTAGGNGILQIPKGCAHNLQSITWPNSLVTIDQQHARVMVGNIFFAPSLQAGGGSLLFSDARPTHATRILVEPSGPGRVSGTTAKLDLMGSSYQTDGTNYTLGNAVFIADDPTASSGWYPGVFLLSAKGVGGYFGASPWLHFGTNDNSAVATPMKVGYLNTNLTQFYAPQRGCWFPGLLYNAEDYVTYANHIYFTAAGGTSGSTPPTHSSGTVSDGAVSWEFILDYVPDAQAQHFKPLVMIGDRDDRPKLGLPETRLQLSKDVSVFNGQAINLLGNADPVAEIAWKFYAPTNTTDARVESGDGTRFTRWGSSFVQKQGLSNCLASKGISDGSATPDVTGAEKIIFNNGSPTSVSQLVGSANQFLVVQSANGQTTLVNGANLKTATGADRVLSANSTLLFAIDSSGLIAREIGLAA